MRWSLIPKKRYEANGACLTLLDTMKVRLKVPLQNGSGWSHIFFSEATAITPID